VGDKCYVVVSGEAEVIRDGQYLNVLRPGDVFGEMALISDKPRSATIRAKTPLDLVAISRDAFHTLVTHLPGVKTAINEVLRQHTGGTHITIDPANVPAEPVAAGENRP
jgi:NADH dehydrogenase